MQRVGHIPCLLASDGSWIAPSQAILPTLDVAGLSHRQARPGLGTTTTGKKHGVTDRLAEWGLTLEDVERVVGRRFLHPLMLSVDPPTVWTALGVPSWSLENTVSAIEASMLNASNGEGEVATCARFVSQCEMLDDVRLPSSPSDLLPSLLQVYSSQMLLIVKYSHNYRVL